MVTPGLWATIVLYGHRPLRALEPLLKRTGSVPLYLDLDVAGEASYPGTECPLERVFEVATIVTMEMARIVRLQLRYLPPHISIIRGITRSPAPLLEDLVIMCGGIMNLTEFDAPRLRRLEVDRMQLSSFSLAGHLLDTIVLRSVQLDLVDLHALCASTPLLESLELEDVGFLSSAPLQRGTWHCPCLRRAVVTHPIVYNDEDIIPLLLGHLPIVQLDVLLVTLDPDSKYDGSPEREIETLFTVLEPKTLRVSRTSKNIWTAELGGTRHRYVFPQRVGGRVISALLENSARSVRRYEADDAFCNQLERRSEDLPYLPYFEGLDLIPDARGLLPATAAAALRALQQASETEPI